MDPLRMTATLMALTLLGIGAAQADWLEQLFKKAQELQAAPAATSALTDEEVIRGLKEALSQGTRRAIGQLGREGGYLNNLNVRIPMPESLHKVEKALRSLGQDRYADEFIAALNHAAERAVPEAATIFGDTLTKMSLADARTILTGPDDAATQYFRKYGEAQLRERFLPIVQQATDQAGVTSAYKKLMQKAGVFTRHLGRDTTDLDAYVTNKALDGLFRMIAEEEKRIRQDPLARSTELLKKVFGAAGR